LRDFGEAGRFRRARLVDLSLALILATITVAAAAA
jgi:hypothetical protein